MTDALTSVADQTPFRWRGEPLTVADLDAWAAKIAGNAIPGTALFTHAMQASIIVHFLGRRWFDDHANLQSPPTSYLHPRFGEDGLAGVYSSRLLNLAEMLFNLQGVENFRTCLDHMALDQLESGLCELQIGMMLYQDRIAFRYIDAAMAASKSPDIEIRLADGATALADIKCKYETTDVSEATMLDALRAAIPQLPKGKPGLIFVKVPQGWTHDAGEEVILPMTVVNATTRFLTRDSTRVAKVIFYLFHLSPNQSGILNRHAVHEMNNPRNPPNSPWNSNLFPPAHSDFEWITYPSLLERWTGKSTHAV